MNSEERYSNRSTERKTREHTANNILSKYLYLEAAAVNEGALLNEDLVARSNRMYEGQFRQDTDFVIDPRYKTDVEFEADQDYF